MEENPPLFHAQCLVSIRPKFRGQRVKISNHNVDARIGCRDLWNVNPFVCKRRRRVR
jgi:hypothetical protein